MFFRFICPTLVFSLILGSARCKVTPQGHPEEPVTQLASLLVSEDLPPAVRANRSNLYQNHGMDERRTWAPQVSVPLPGKNSQSENSQKPKIEKKPLVSPRKKKSPPPRNWKEERRIVRVLAKKGLQLRRQPWGEIIESLPFGSEVQLLGELRDEWAFVRSEIQTGFVYSKYIALEREPEPSPYQYVELPGIRTISQNRVDPFDPEGRRGRYPSGYCGPASLQMVLDYFGVQRSRDFLALTDVGGGKIYKVGRGSAYAPMVTMSKHLGFNATEMVWSDSLDAIYERLWEGRPQIVSLRGPLRFKSGGRNRVTRGHIVVVTGMSRHGDVILHDPAGAGNRTVMSEKNFLKVWRGFMVDIKTQDSSQIGKLERGQSEDVSKRA